MNSKEGIYMKNSQFSGISPVLPSQDIDRDVVWYEKHTGFTLVHKDKMYAVLKRDHLSLHLQWHTDHADDPLLGGSVIKIFVKNLEPLFMEFVKRGTIDVDQLNRRTPWGTNEFGFYDLNKNAIFLVESLSS